jgi:hypothetical protein
MINLMMNMITSDKFVHEVKNGKESLLETTIIDSYECDCDKVDMFKESLDEIVEFSSKFCAQQKDVIMRFALKMISNESNLPSVNDNASSARECNCRICKQSHITDIDQHTLIEHFVTLTNIKKDGTWCMSSDLLNCTEQYIQAVNKDSRIKCKMNRNTASQSLSEFIEKKRRIAGMTFNCVLPTSEIVTAIAQSTSLLINQKSK